MIIPGFKATLGILEPVAGPHEHLGSVQHRDLFQIIVEADLPQAARAKASNCDPHVPSGNIAVAKARDP